MCYRITYENNLVKKKVVRKNNNTLLKRAIYAIFLCIILFCVLSGSKVRSYLLPGDPQVTEKALKDLVVDLKEGDTVSDAVTAFCKEIIENA